MARQPSKSLNLRQLSFNTSTGLYDAEEDGIVYHLTFEQMNDLKIFYLGSQAVPPIYSRWFNDLDKIEKQKVKRSGKIPMQSNNFFPDVEPEY